MATDLERLVVQLSADVKRYENALNRAMGVTNKQTRAIESRFAKMNKNINASFANTLRSGVAIAGGAFSTREIMQYADAWTQAGNMIAAAAQSAGVQTRSLEDLRKGADEARTSLETYTDLYARLIRSASGVAKSEEEIALATNLVAKAMKAGGASTQEQASSILQLGQALGSGVLQGDELRSLRENAPIIAKAIADEFGVTVAGLKKLGEEGKLTSDRVFRAIINAQKPIEAQFAKTNATIGDGFTLLRNSLTQYIGETAEAYGVTQTLNGILAALAGNISSVANAAAAAGVVLAATFTRGAAIAAIGALANPFVAAAAAIGAATFALSAFGDEIQPIAGDIANLQDYAGALWDILKEGSAVAADAVVAAFNGLSDLISSALGGVEVDFGALLDTAISAADGVLNAFSIAYDTLVTTFTKLPAAVAESAVNAVNTMIELISNGIEKIVAGINTVIRAANSAAGIFGMSSPIGEIEFGGLGQLTNKFAGAGEDAAKAYADALKNGADTHIRDAINTVSSAVLGVGEEVRQRANSRARDRAIINSENARRRALGGGGYGSEGFGNAPPPGSGSGGGGRGSRRANDLQREIEQIKERTAALQAETAALAGLNPLIDDYGYTLEKARAKQDLLTAAKRAGIAVTPELEASIEKLAEGYAQASVEAEKLAESQERARQTAEEMRDLGKDVLGGFIRDLREGKSAAEALASALDKVVDKLIDIALNSVFGGGGGGVGGLLGGAIIPGILHSGGVVGRDGYGHGRAVSPAVFAGAPRYHRGGVAGLRPGEVPAILQRGEVVLPRGTRMAARAGGASNVTYSPSYWIDARGSQMTEAQFRAIIEENNRRVVPQIAISAVGRANRVSTNPSFRGR